MNFRLENHARESSIVTKYIYPIIIVTNYLEILCFGIGLRHCSDAPRFFAFDLISSNTEGMEMESSTYF